MSDTAISVQHLVKRFGTTTVLDDFTRFVD